MIQEWFEQFTSLKVKQMIINTFIIINNPIYKLFNFENSETKHSPDFLLLFSFSRGLGPARLENV